MSDQPKRMSHVERQARREQIVAFMRGGSRTLVEAAEKFGLSVWSVKAFCQAAGLPWVRNVPTYKQGNTFACLAELFKPNQTLQEIAERMKLSKQRVVQVYEAAAKVSLPGLPSREGEIVKYEIVKYVAEKRPCPTR